MVTSGVIFRRSVAVLLPISFVSGVGTKVRPAVVVQNDNLNDRLDSTVVAIITSNNTRSEIEPSQLLVDINTPDGKQTGLLHDSTVKDEYLDTVDQRDIVRKIGGFSPELMERFAQCIKAALKIS